MARADPRASAVVVLQDRPDGRIEQLAVHALQGFGQDALGLARAGIGSKQRGGGGTLGHPPRVGRVGAHRHGQQVAHAGLAGLRAQRRQGLARQALQPRVRILEQRPQLRRRRIGPRPQATQRLAGAVAGVAVGTGQHFSSVGHEIPLAPAQGLGRALAHRRRPARQAGQQLLGRAPVVGNRSCRSRRRSRVPRR